MKKIKILLIGFSLLFCSNFVIATNINEEKTKEITNLLNEEISKTDYSNLRKELIKYNLLENDFLTIIRNKKTLKTEKITFNDFFLEIARKELKIKNSNKNNKKKLKSFFKRLVKKTDNKLQCFDIEFKFIYSNPNKPPRLQKIKENSALTEKINIKNNKELKKQFNTANFEDVNQYIKNPSFNTANFEDVNQYIKNPSSPESCSFLDENNFINLIDEKTLNAQKINLIYLKKLILEKMISKYNPSIQSNEIKTNIILAKNNPNSKELNYYNLEITYNKEKNYFKITQEKEDKDIFEKISLIAEEEKIRDADFEDLENHLKKEYSYDYDTVKIINKKNLNVENINFEDLENLILEKINSKFIKNSELKTNIILAKNNPNSKDLELFNLEIKYNKEKNNFEITKEQKNEELTLKKTKEKIKEINFENLENFLDKNYLLQKEKLWINKKIKNEQVYFDFFKKSLKEFKEYIVNKIENNLSINDIEKGYFPFQKSFLKLNENKEKQNVKNCIVDFKYNIIKNEIEIEKIVEEPITKNIKNFEEISYLSFKTYFKKKLRYKDLMDTYLTGKNNVIIVQNPYDKIEKIKMEKINYNDLLKKIFNEKFYNFYLLNTNNICYLIKLKQNLDESFNKIVIEAIDSKYKTDESFSKIGIESIDSEYKTDESFSKIEIESIDSKYKTYEHQQLMKEIYEKTFEKEESNDKKITKKEIVFNRNYIKKELLKLLINSKFIKKGEEDNNFLEIADPEYNYTIFKKSFEQEIFYDFMSKLKKEFEKNNELNCYDIELSNYCLIDDDDLNNIKIQPIKIKCYINEQNKKNEVITPMLVLDTKKENEKKYEKIENKIKEKKLTNLIYKQLTNNYYLKNIVFKKMNPKTFELNKKYLNLEELTKEIVKKLHNSNGIFQKGITEFNFFIKKNKKTDQAYNIKFIVNFPKEKSYKEIKISAETNEFYNTKIENLIGVEKKEELKNLIDKELKKYKELKNVEEFIRIDLKTLKKMEKLNLEQFKEEIINRFFSKKREIFKKGKIKISDFVIKNNNSYKRLFFYFIINLEEGKFENEIILKKQSNINFANFAEKVTKNFIKNIEKKSIKSKNTKFLEFNEETFNSYLKNKMLIENNKIKIFYPHRINKIKYFTLEQFKEIIKETISNFGKKCPIIENIIRKSSNGNYFCVNLELFCEKNPTNNNDIIKINNLHENKNSTIYLNDFLNIPNKNYIEEKEMISENIPYYEILDKLEEAGLISNDIIKIYKEKENKVLQFNSMSFMKYLKSKINKNLIKYDDLTIKNIIDNSQCKNFKLRLFFYPKYNWLDLKNPKHFVFLGFNLNKEANKKYKENFKNLTYEIVEDFKDNEEKEEEKIRNNKAEFFKFKELLNEKITNFEYEKNFISKAMSKIERLKNFIITSDKIYIYPNNQNENKLHFLDNSNSYFNDKVYKFFENTLSKKIKQIDLTYDRINEEKEFFVKNLDEHYNSIIQEFSNDFLDNKMPEKTYVFTINYTYKTKVFFKIKKFLDLNLIEEFENSEYSFLKDAFIMYSKIENDYYELEDLKPKLIIPVESSSKQKEIEEFFKEKLEEYKKDVNNILLNPEFLKNDNFKLNPMTDKNLALKLKKIFKKHFYNPKLCSKIESVLDDYYNSKNIKDYDYLDYEKFKKSKFSPFEKIMDKNYKAINPTMDVIYYNGEKSDTSHNESNDNVKDISDLSILYNNKTNKKIYILIKDPYTKKIKKEQRERKEYIPNLKLYAKEIKKVWYYIRDNFPFFNISLSGKQALLLANDFSDLISVFFDFLFLREDFCFNNNCEKTYNFYYCKEFGEIFTGDIETAKIIINVTFKTEKIKNSEYLNEVLNFSYEPLNEIFVLNIKISIPERENFIHLKPRIIASKVFLDEDAIKKINNLSSSEKLQKFLKTKTENVFTEEIKKLDLKPQNISLNQILEESKENQEYINPVTIKTSIDFANYLATADVSYYNDCIKLKNFSIKEDRKKENEEKKIKRWIKYYNQQKLNTKNLNAEEKKEENLKKETENEPKNLNEEEKKEKEEKKEENLKKETENESKNLNKEKKKKEEEKKEDEEKKKKEEEKKENEEKKIKRWIKYYNQQKLNTKNLNAEEKKEENLKKETENEPKNLNEEEKKEKNLKKETENEPKNLNAEEKKEENLKKETENEPKNLNEEEKKEENLKKETENESKNLNKEKKKEKEEKKEEEKNK